LSGTGKTTLSADPNALCSAMMSMGGAIMELPILSMAVMPKLINLNPKKEPEIHQAVFHQDHYLEHGAIVENALMFRMGPST
jgi:ATP-dependent phosphoenolpyruvate carboxykinase